MTAFALSKSVADAGREALTERLMKSAAGTFDVFTIYIGDRLGLYRALAHHGPATAPELAQRAGVHRRYLREWLEQQAVVGILGVDERVGSSFMADDGDLDWMMYGWSVLHCLPVGMADAPAVGTGTVMRRSTLTKYATAAGFSRVEVLPIETDFFRFYRLHR